MVPNTPMTIAITGAKRSRRSVSARIGEAIIARIGRISTDHHFAVIASGTRAITAAIEAILVATRKGITLKGLRSGGPVSIFPPIIPDAIKNHKTTDTSNAAKGGLHIFLDRAK